MEKLVSIIIPAYKVEKYVGKCIESILSSTYKNFEILIVNDCSPDNTEEKILGFDDKRIKYIRNVENLGASSTRNRGLEEARGEYLLFIDADDFISSNWIEDLVYSIEETGADIVIGKSKEVSEEKTDDYTIKELVAPNFIDSKDIRLSKNAVLWNKMYSRKKLGKIRFNTKVKTGQDLLYNYKAIIMADKIYYNEKGYYYYRLDNIDSITNSKTKKDMTKSNVEILNAMVSYKENENKLHISTMKKIAKDVLFNWNLLSNEERESIKLPIKEIRKISMFMPELVKLKVISKKIRKKV